MLSKFKRWNFGIGLLCTSFCTSNINAIPYVQGVDYLPEHYVTDENDINHNKFISGKEIENDFFRMSKNFNAIRTYEYDNINLQRILRAAKRYDMKVAVGINIDSRNKAKTNAQVAGLNKMFEQYPDLKSPVITVVVGHNAIRDPQRYFSLESAYLLSQIKKISSFEWFKNSTISLSVSETDTTLLSNAGIHFLGQISKINLHDRITLLVSINPYMSGCTVEEAIGKNKTRKCGFKSFPERWKRLMARREIKNFQVAIGETGWPTKNVSSDNKVKTVPGTPEDAKKYYEFLYPFLYHQSIRDTKVSIPFFVFSAFDEPENGIFGFSSNYWGVYSAEREPKPGMVFPIQDRTVKPTSKLGTNVHIYLPKLSGYAELPILFKTKDTLYSNIIPEKKKESLPVYSFIDEYPFVDYSLTGKSDTAEAANIVSLVLPNGGDKDHPSATCTNELISGSGYSAQIDMNLQWKYPKSKEENCQNIAWSKNGIWIN